MDRLRRSLAYDLVDTDLADPGALTSLVVAHTVAPARAAWGMPAPRSGEGRSFLVEREEIGADGVLVQHMRRWRFDESTPIFDPLVRGLLLFAWLFPQSVHQSQGATSVLSRPGWAVIDDSIHLMSRPHEAIADLVAGLLGAPLVRPPWCGLYKHAPARNDNAMTQLADAQRLVARSLDPVPAESNTCLIDIGLRRIDEGIAAEADQIARTDVRRRLVWFGSYEPEIVTNGDGDLDVGDGIITLERGVFAADIPESLCGLVLLDLTEQLGSDRETARCQRCGLLMRLSAQQKSRARLGLHVYHPDCRDEQRLAYFRRKSRERYADRKLRRRSTGASRDRGAVTRARQHADRGADRG